jgi:hypothetical protein
MAIDTQEILKEALELPSKEIIFCPAWTSLTSK